MIFYGTTLRSRLTEENILEVYFNIILPSTLRSSKSFLSLRFPHEKAVCAFSLPYKYHVRHTHPILDFITPFIFHDDYSS